MFKAEYLFVRILIPFIAGILFFYSLAEILMLKILCLAAFFLFLMLSAGAVWYQKAMEVRLKMALNFLLTVIFLVLGGVLCLSQNETLRNDYFTKTSYHTLGGYIVNEPDVRNGIARLKIRTITAYENGRALNVSGDLLLAIQLDSLKPVHLQYGNELLIRAEAFEIEPPYNPHEFNYKSWLANQNIYHQAFVQQNQIIKTGMNKGNSIIRIALELRQRMVNKYKELLVNPESIHIASTLILGYRAELDQETLDIYSRTGTIHALSVSGAHVGLIYAIIVALLSFLNKGLKLKIFKFFLICTLIWSYAILTGLSPSVVRSAIMISVFTGAKTFVKTKNNYNILAFSAFCQLVYNPYSVFDVGFQLSYLAVFGLIYLQPKIYQLWYFRNKVSDYLWKFTALSLAAQLFTFPLSIFYFHQFPLYFLLGNLFITVPLALMMYLGLIVLLPGFGFLGVLLDWLIIYTNSGLKWIAELPFSTFKAIWIDWPEMLLLYVAIACSLYAFQESKKIVLYIAFISYTVYVGLVSFDDVSKYEQKRIIFYSLRRNYAVAFISGKKAVIVTGLDIKDKNFNYYVKPSLDESQVNELTLITAETDTVINEFALSKNQIIFNGYKLLLADRTFNNKILANGVIFSGIWLRNNSNFDFKLNKKKLYFEDIIIDATNSDYKIQSFLNFDWNKTVKTFVLKKNKAYLVNLKP